jgi:hypothetical protein
MQAFLNFYCAKRSANAVALVVIPLLLLVAGCLPFSNLASTAITDLSGRYPYKAFVGRIVASKEVCSIWNNTIRLGTGSEIPGYRTDLEKVAELPMGTQIKIRSIKRVKTTSEISNDDSIRAYCTVFLKSGNKLDCEMAWDLLNPDAIAWPKPRFELIDK